MKTHICLFISLFFGAFVFGIQANNFILPENSSDHFNFENSLDYQTNPENAISRLGPIYYTISGTVTHQESGEPFVDVTVEFSNGIGSVFTDTLGNYSVEVQRFWSGTATPYYCGYYDFTPPVRYYTNVKKDYAGQNYIGAAVTMFLISGTFIDSYSSVPISNELIDFGNGISATTNSFGEYFIEVFPCWGGTLTPVSEDYNFTPESRSYTNVTSDFINQDYSGLPSSFGLPPGWDYINTGSAHIISVTIESAPNYCGIPLQEGDFIGVFYIGDDGEQHCGGAGEWTGEANVALIAQGDDNTTPEKDGFGYGELMNWRVYSWTGNEQEYVATVGYQTGGFLISNNRFYTMALSIVNQLDAYYKHNIEIPTGWSGISSYIIPKSGLQSIVNLTEPINDELIIIQNLTGMYFPGQGINTLYNWDSHSGYKIKVSDTAELPIIGCPDANLTVDLLPTWNIIPVLSKSYVPVNDLFALVMDKLIVVKEIAGMNIFWPEMGIQTLMTLSPAKAYLVAVNNNCSVTYPESGENLKLTPVNFSDKNIQTTWNDPIKTVNDHIIAIKTETLLNIENGDIIGAFTNEGICAGVVEISDNSRNYSITLFGDDPTTPVKEGFLSGEILSFRLYRPSENSEYNLQVNFDISMPSVDGKFSANGLSSFKELLFDPTSVNGVLSENVSIYPNPCNGKLIIRASNQENIYEIRILNTRGEEVIQNTLSGEKVFNLSNLQRGIYIIKIYGESFLKVEKLILN